MAFGGPTVLHYFRELDELLRGRRTTLAQFAAGTAHLQLRPLVGVSLLLAVIYGECMGSFSLVNRPDPQYMQMLATGVKVPALFFLTLVVTFPSLYVFTALLGVSLGPLDTLRVVVAALAVNIAVLASFALITLFFTFCTTSYDFMKLLNLAFFATGGLIGLGSLMTMLQRIEQAAQPAAGPPRAGTPEVTAPSLMPWPLPAERTSARRVFRVWVVLYAVVGAQMGWVLRPFIGKPNLAFTWFRDRQANIFVDAGHTLAHLFGW